MAKSNKNSKSTSKKIKESLKASSKKSSKAKSPRRTIDSVTMELLRKPGGVTLKEVAAAVSKEFPNHDADTVLVTSRRRLHGYLANRYKVTIKKDDKGKYRIAS